MVKERKREIKRDDQSHEIKKKKQSMINPCYNVAIDSIS